MPRLRLLLAALAALLLVSTGTAHAQRESDERRLRDQLADRDEYRTKLLLEVQRRETLLTRQQDALEKQEKRLQEMYAKLQKPITDEDEDADTPQAQPQPAAVRGARKVPPDTPQSKRAKDYDTQVYKTNLARYNVAHTRQEIADLRTLLARNP
ncbi:MAG: hypothetical protein HY060_07895 [Proteobacteria bacterium]|nr:hypothetical protein [Pseudomonadota bacterium]